MTHPSRSALVAALLTTVALAGCSATSQTPDQSDEETVTLVTHDSWAIPKNLRAAFEEESGFDLEVLRSGDTGQLTNKLVLTQDNPLGDAVFGIDNTFATRAVDGGVLAAYTPEDLPASADEYRLGVSSSSTTGHDVLTPVDWGDVCVNVDNAWFDEQQIDPPRTLDDLLDPAYADLFVTPAPPTSSPGFAFLLATIGRYGEQGWPDYWAGLMDNGTRIASGWSEAYEVDFTAGSGQGDRPIVLSYNSSPPFTIPEGGRRPTTSALLDTCFRQVEYAGVLDGTDNVEGARALVDFMVSREFQEALPESMYVFPVDADAQLPELWATWAPPASDPIEVDPADVSRQREDWLREWSDVTAG
jgi:thiamine transport system substrate-binding protein